MSMCVSIQCHTIYDNDKESHELNCEFEIESQK